MDPIDSKWIQKTDPIDFKKIHNRSNRFYIDLKWIQIVSSATHCVLDDALDDGQRQIKILGSFGHFYFKFIYLCAFLYYYCYYFSSLYKFSIFALNVHYTQLRIYLQQHIYIWKLHSRKVDERERALTLSLFLFSLVFSLSLSLFRYIV